jgi:hypothetical protein
LTLDGNIQNEPELVSVQKWALVILRKLGKFDKKLFGLIFIKVKVLLVRKIFRLLLQVFLVDRVELLHFQSNASPFIN